MKNIKNKKKKIYAYVDESGQDTKGVIFIAIVFGFFAFSIWAYRKLIVKVAEEV